MAIPRADREVLRAQARAGRQGVQAYEAAKAELDRGRQRVVRQAMQEAALRGAPAGAMKSIRGEITSPYRLGGIQLNREQSLYEQDLASRQRRMADYNRAILSSRHLIGDETAQAVAPIRAQGRFDVAQINAQSAARVAELEAQARLTEAQMRAASAKAAGSGGGSAPTLNQSELAAALESGGQSILEAATSEAQDIAARNREQMAQDPKVQRTLQQAIGDREAARWGYAATVGEAARQAAGVGTSPNTIHLPGLGPFGGADLELPREQPGIDIPGLGPFAGGRIELPTPTVSNTPGLADLIANYQRTAAAHQQAESPYFSTETGYLTPRNFQGLANRYSADLVAPMLQTAQANPVQGATDIARAMGGEPMINPVTGMQQGEGVMPAAQATWQEAMQLAAMRLAKQGYDITVPEVQVALTGNRGNTLYDLQAAARGLPSGRERIQETEDAARAAIAQQQQDLEDQAAAADQAETDRQSALDAARKDAEDRIQIAESGQKQDFFNKFGVPMPTDAGPVADIYDTAFNDPQFSAIQQSVLQAIQNGDNGGDIDAILSDLGVVDPLYHNILKGMYG